MIGWFEKLAMALAMLFLVACTAAMIAITVMAVRTPENQVVKWASDKGLLYYELNKKTGKVEHLLDQESLDNLVPSPQRERTDPDVSFGDMVDGGVVISVGLYSEGVSTPIKSMKAIGKDGIIRIYHYYHGKWNYFQAEGK
jgi:hypothetical protein